MTLVHVESGRAALIPEPFPHLHLPRAVDAARAADALAWLERDAPWRRQGTAGLYEADFVDLLRASLPPTMETWVDAGSRAGLAEALGDLFGARLAGDPDVEAHRLVPGQRVAVHNDDVDGHSHRLLLQLNRGWSLADGGLTVLLTSRDCERFRPTDRIYPPHHGSALAFEISERSLHAVTDVTGGDRYTLVYSFRRRS